MNNFNKSSVKLLPIIENTNNRVTFYTEFDGEFEVGDKLYIAVNNTGITEYTVLDSMVNTGCTDSAIGYELLQKDGNRIVLDIIYDTFILTLNSLSVDTCFIGRVYVTNSTIDRGIINGCLIKDTSTQPLSKSNIIWKQGILFDTIGSINNIDFESKSDNSKLVLKTIINSKGEVESFYTYNNYGIGLSIINLSDNIFQLNECNISAGVFNHCDVEGSSNQITGGELYNCFIGDTYIINGGRLVDSEFATSNVTWLNGTWSSNYTGDTANNPFKSLTWEDGTWEDGIFPLSSTWIKGRFIDGTFNGLSWNGGEFDDGIFSGTTWSDGIFNDGLILNSQWLDGTFNNGVIIDTRWHNGTFNNGAIYSTDTTYPYTHRWDNGIFNNGIITHMDWRDGVFNNGTMSGCSWATGDFYNGKLAGGSEWTEGNWYNGEFEDSVWKNGKFYNGIMKNSWWLEGSVYYGVFIDMSPFDYGVRGFYQGIWYNGTMNNVEVSNVQWFNGIANDSTLGNSFTSTISSNFGIRWYDGSFNSGTFGDTVNTAGDYIWYDGKFYYGTFAGDDWVNGTFYTGDILTYVNPKFKTNKPFKPYNEYGAFRSKSKKVRLPKHSRTSGKYSIRKREDIVDMIEKSINLKNLRGNT